jgi:hypothetical protein
MDSNSSDEVFDADFNQKWKRQKVVEEDDDDDSHTTLGEGDKGRTDKQNQEDTQDCVGYEQRPAVNLVAAVESDVTPTQETTRIFTYLNQEQQLEEEGREDCGDAVPEATL